jgi:hypothetical protein
MQKDTIQDMKPFYVYELRDPRDNAVFYVGKGKGRRAKQHELDAVNTGEETSKIIRIREIHDADKEVNVIVVGRYDSEQEALAVESTLIKWVHGFKNLTNLVHGHNHHSIRAQDDLSEINGIDIPRKSYLMSGEYKEAVLRDVRQNYVMEDLEVLKASIIDAIPNIRVSEPKILSTQDPSIVIGYNENIRIQLILSRVGKQTVVMNLLPSEWRTDQQRNFIDICQRVGLEPKANGKYAKPVEWKKLSPDMKEIGVIAERLSVIKRELEVVGEMASY